MTYQGIDTAARITAVQAKKMRENGISFAGRYLGPESWGKTVTKAEADALLAEGVSILLCYETSAERMRGGTAAGTADGANALRYARELGVPVGTCIFFACDYDVPDSDLIRCENYITAAQSAMGGVYEAGCYGPEKIVSFLSDRGDCFKFWQCCAWSNQFLPVASVRQYAWQGDARSRAMAKKLGIAAVDLDAGEDLRGLWGPSQSAAQTAPPEGEPRPSQPPSEAVSPEGEPWYDEAMAWAEAQGLIMDGRPNDDVTRAELATVLQRYDAVVDAKIAEAAARLVPEDTKNFSGLLTD